MNDSLLSLRDVPGLFVGHRTDASGGTGCTVILAPDGFYYAYATQTLRDGHWVNIQVARSADLVHWDHLGDALPEKPGWAQTLAHLGKQADGTGGVFAAGE